MSSQNSKHHFCEAAREKRKKNIVTSDNTRMERAERGTMRDEASSENIQDQKSKDIELKKHSGSAHQQAAC
jgi:hypothetical protein